MEMPVPDDLHIPPIQGRHVEYATYRPQPQGDRLTRTLLLAAAALGGVLALGMGGWALLGRHPAAVPVIEADGRPVRVRPENAGGMQVAGADEQVMGGQAGGVQAMAPPAEVPAPQALRAQMQTQASVPGGAGPAVPAQAAGGTAGATPAAASSTATASPLPDTARPASRAAAVANPAVRPTAPSATRQPPAATLSAAGTATGAPSPATGAASAVLQAPVQPPPPVQLAPASPPAPASPASGTAAGTAALGGTMVQVAAMKTEQEAQAEWQRLAKRMPDALGGRNAVVQRAERDGKQVWRVRTGGFADVAEATAFCVRLRAKGADCTIAAF